MPEDTNLSTDLLQEFERTLKNNLRSIREISPDLFQSLSTLSAKKYWSRLIQTRDSNYTCRVEFHNKKNMVGSAYYPWAEAEKQLGAMSIPPGNKAVRYFGIGLGYHLKLLLKKLADDQRVYVYEKEPDGLILALSVHDLSEEIASGTLSIFLEGATGMPDKISKTENDIIWSHPVMRKVYQSYYDALLGRFESISSAATPSALIIHRHPHAAYLNLSSAVHEALENMGWKVNKCSGALSEIRQNIFQNDPHLLFSLSYSSEIAEISCQAKIPYICWELDKIMNASLINPEFPMPQTYVYSTYLDDVEKFKQAGMNAYYLPAAANSLLKEDFVVSQKDLEKYDGDISFVGSPLLSANNDFWLFVENVNKVMKEGNEEIRKEGEALLKNLRNAVDKQNEYTQKNVFKLPEILSDELEGALPSCFSFSLDQLTNITAKECCSFQRIYFLEKLSPLCVHVYGNPDWLFVKKKNLVYKGEAGFDFETGKIYQASKINIDLTRIYQLDGFSDRVFNVLWSGGFLVMNRTRTIDRSFDVGKELVVFDTAEELKEICEYYLNNEKERLDIAERGKNRVKKEHSIKARVKEMLSRLPARDTCPNE